MRQEIKDKVNIELLNTDALIEDLCRKKFTGLVKITTWEGEDYIPFYEGEVQKIYIITKDRIEETSYTSYGFPQTGVVEIIETDIMSLVNGLREDFDPGSAGPLALAGYGEEFQPTVSALQVDINHFVELARKSRFNGYMLFHTPREPVGMVVFYNGEAVGIFAPGRVGERAQGYIGMNLNGSLVSIFLLDSEFIPLLLAMEKLERLKSGKVMSKEELDVVRDDAVARRMSALLYLGGGRAKKYYQFFYKGREVKSILQELFRMENISQDSIDFPGDFALYPLYIDAEPKPISINISPAPRVVDSVPTGRLAKLKDAG
ncbi:MAG: hypothetical protein Q9N34_03680 [Aquificota bacterium]|nr:hypothetical protein [Aquificota bacterium]